MFHAVKTVRACPFSSFPRSPNFDRKISLLRFRQTQSVSVYSQPDTDREMDKPPHDPNETPADVMSHSFGEGYATRSDEEGFGGIYGGNESASKIEADKFIHENHPAYDKTQGSEVKEKEKARHQTSASN
ncbi:uncharacterized protein LOC129284433 [Prosopis cineraria]|uniref:uncharacterized protein LOC129284433 n=1 Tax=Prosopis cineraria TaxID=364024 RepID=UPI00240F5973|nr:uncharacterized protein LOC129284433 [Prosopis cineraria]